VAEASAADGVDVAAADGGGGGGGVAIGVQRSFIF